MHDHKINMATMIKHTHIKPNTGFCLTVPGGRAIYFVRQFESTDVFFKTLLTWRRMEAVVSRQKGSNDEKRQEKRQSSIVSCRMGE